MKKAIILSVMVVFGGVAMAQTIPANTNVVTFEKTNADVGVLITRDSKGELISAVAITKKSLEAKVAQKVTVDAEAVIAQQRLAILNGTN